MDSKAAHYKAQLEDVFVLDEQGHADDAATKATEISEQALAEGDAAYAKFFLGESYCLKGDLKKGVKLEAEAVEQLGEVAFLHANFGVLLSVTGHVKKALKHLDIALGLDPEDLQALAQKGVCLAKINRFEEALESFEHILKQEPENLHALRNKGVCLSNMYHEDEAMEIFNRVLEMNPDDSHARSEKNILKAELELRRTPFGWLAYKVRKSIIPSLRALKAQLFG